MTTQQADWQQAVGAAARIRRNARDTRQRKDQSYFWGGGLLVLAQIILSLGIGMGAGALFLLAPSLLLGGAGVALTDERKIRTIMRKRQEQGVEAWLEQVG